MDQPIPKLIFFFILITFLLDIISIVQREILFRSLVRLKRINYYSEKVVLHVLHVLRGIKPQEEKLGLIQMSLQLYINPFTPEILLVILLTVCFTILVMLVLRIWSLINLKSLIYIFLYSHNLSAQYCIDIVRRNSALVTHGS